MVYFENYNSPVGCLSLASDGEHLCGLWIEGQKYYQDKLELRLGVKKGAIDIEQDSQIKHTGVTVLEKTRRWLDIYFSGKEPPVMPEIFPRGTDFQKEVWAELLAIPYGQLTNYGTIAQKTADKRKKASARAVGSAVGHNPISIILPCHRVIGSDNSLTGYAGGIERKIYLLELEGVDVSKLYVPRNISKFAHKT
jgi:methylated-DNA-[protein]-cysteine S-methyltransferase